LLVGWIDLANTLHGERVFLGHEAV
jgi:hypothetical protein